MSENSNFPLQSACLYLKPSDLYGIIAHIEKKDEDTTVLNRCIELLADLKGYKQLYDASENNRTAAVFGIDVHKAYFAALLNAGLNKRTYIIVPDEASARIVNEIMQSEVGGSWIYPAKDYSFRDIESVSRFAENRRLEILSRIRENKIRSVVIPADALCALAMSPDEYREIRFDRGMEYDFDSIADRLVSLGYEFAATVEGPGQFSVRGGIVDVFSPAEDQPFRIEFFGNETDTVSYFDVNTQRRTELLDSAKIVPTREQTSELRDKLRSILERFAGNIAADRDMELLSGGILPKHDRYLPAYFGKKANILDYVRDEDEILVFNWREVRERIDGFNFRLNEDIKLLAEEGLPFLKEDYSFTTEEIVRKIRTPIVMESLPCSVNEFTPDDVIDIKLFPTSISTYLTLREDIRGYIETGVRVFILANDSVHADELSKELGPADNLTVCEGTIPFGFNAPELNTVVYSYKNITKPESKRSRRKKFESGERVKNFSDITPGDYVVHANYGVGVYEGMHKVEQQGVVKDFLKIRYAGTDTLYVPCTSLDSISKYTGVDTEQKVTLNKLGSGDWQKTKTRVKKAVRDLAKQLIQLYGTRAKTKGHSFAVDTEWQRDFEASFEFEETEDQLKCIQEIKKDMEDQKPMDRLLCGDVGFGKTEVALRAVFKAVMDSKQVAILAPTTILAYQHYNTMLRRFYGYPIKVELMSRFKTPKQNEETLKKMRKGLVDVVVGTHRLVQKDVEFKDLGLVIIDEEQRFGVAHKEHLKESFPGADFLTLSATPIPRTLNMSLSGIRDISVLNEPPKNRYPVTTYVAEYDEGVATDAIRREVSRGGQCFYLHNRVETIYHKADMIRERTGYRVDVAHGQMSKDEISSVWQRLIDGETDVLVCTTIIETGVDVPNCNTLIIEDADRMGLAQLHQIRGRVGRTDRRAYAYFLFKRGKTLSSDAYKRLMTIQQFTEFGSGLKIAMRDLEIRGAGDILGAEQSGHLMNVGFDLYMKLLNEAVLEEQGKTVQKLECTVDLKADAYIPDDYISDGENRIELYKMIACITNNDDYMDVTDYLIDRYGEPPVPVIKLMKAALLRSEAGEAGISDISHRDGKLLFTFAAVPPLIIVPELSAKFKGRVLFSAGAKPYFTLKCSQQLDDALGFVREVKKALDTLGTEEEKKEQ